MRKLMAIIAALVIFGGIAFAAVTTGTFGDRNSSGDYRMIVDSDGVVTMASDTVFKPTLITDLAIYSATSGTGLNRTVCIDNAGKLFSSATACP